MNHNAMVSHIKSNHINVINVFTIISHNTNNGKDLQASGHERSHSERKTGNKNKQEINRSSGSIHQSV